MEEKEGLIQGYRSMTCCGEVQVTLGKYLKSLLLSFTLRQIGCTVHDMQGLTSPTRIKPAPSAGWSHWAQNLNHWTWEVLYKIIFSLFFRDRKISHIHNIQSHINVTIHRNLNTRPHIFLFRNFSHESDTHLYDKCFLLVFWGKTFKIDEQSYGVCELYFGQGSFCSSLYFKNSVPPLFFPVFGLCWAVFQLSPEIFILIFKRQDNVYNFKWIEECKFSSYIFWTIFVYYQVQGTCYLKFSFV